MARDEDYMKVDDEDGDRLQQDQKGFEAALDISRTREDPTPKAADDSKSDRRQERVTETAPEAEERESPVAAAEAAEEETAQESETTGEEQPEAEAAAAEEPTYTLPGGIKVKASDLFKDHERVQKLVTQANQMTHYQKLADERKQELATQQASEKSIYEKWIEIKMQEEMQRAYAQQQPRPAVVQRPPSDQIRGAFMPYLSELAKQGRISEDHLAEDGGLISEYLYDQMSLRSALENQLSVYEQRINRLEQELGPVQTTVQAERILNFERTVQHQLAGTPGYEDFADPTKWEQLKAFVGQEISAAGTDEYGNPNLRVRFDANRMRAFADAMMAPSMRAALAARKGDLESRQKSETKRAAGESAGTGRPPKKKPQTALSPEELAMDFSGRSVRKATG